MNKIILIMTSLFILNAASGQTRLFEDIKFNDTINKNNFIFFKENKTKTLDEVQFIKASLIIPSIDSIVGYWGIKENIIYFLSDIYINDECQVPSPLFDLNLVMYDSYKIATECYERKDYSLLNYSATSMLKEVCYKNWDTLYSCIHYFNLEGYHVDIVTGDTYKTEYLLQRQFTFSIKSGFTDFSLNKTNCEGCFFPYTPRKQHGNK